MNQSTVSASSLEPSTESWSSSTPLRASVPRLGAICDSNEHYDEHHDQEQLSPPASPPSPQPAPNSTSQSPQQQQQQQQQQPSAQRRYFMRYSLNNSIRSRRSHLRRSSIRCRSSSRAGGTRSAITTTGTATRRSGRMAAARHVRFQPIPLAISISNYTDQSITPPPSCEPPIQAGNNNDNSSNSQDGQNTSSRSYDDSTSRSEISEETRSMMIGNYDRIENILSTTTSTAAMPKRNPGQGTGNDTGGPGSIMHGISLSSLNSHQFKNKQLVRIQQQLNQLSRKSRHHLNSGAKPLTRKLHTLSNLKFSKIKLKSFSTFANQIQQSLTQTTSSSGGDGGPSTSSTTASSGEREHYRQGNESPSEASAAAVVVECCNSCGSDLRRKVEEASSTPIAPCLPPKKQHSSLASKGIKLFNKSRKSKIAQPLLRTFHIRHSAAPAKHTLNKSGPHQQQQQQRRTSGFFDLSGAQDGHNERDADQDQNSAREPALDDQEDGWGSDFDESQSNEDNSLDATNELGGQHQQQHQQINRNGANGRYLLEIGKSSCDTRAVEDVIHDQGTSGQFKRLDMSTTLQQQQEQQCQTSDERGDVQQMATVNNRLDKIRGSLQKVERRHQLASSTTTADSRRNSVTSSVGTSPPASNDNDADQVDTVDEEEEEEEAELRSLEARQGFRQVRDKLKLILDQRLASYERDFHCRRRLTSDAGNDVGASTGATGHHSLALNGPQPVVSSSSSSSSGIGSVSNAVGSQARAEGRRQRQESDDDGKRLEINCSPSESSSPRVQALGSGSSGSGEPVIVHGTNRGHHQTSAMVGGNGNNCDQFDCQSNCSEASSLSSGGLDSNHSGSQDSGHSTQHSGYSTVSCAADHHHHEQEHQQHQHRQHNGHSRNGHCIREDICHHRHHSRNLARSQAAAQLLPSTTSTESSPTNQLDSGTSTCGDEPSPLPPPPPPPPQRPPPTSMLPPASCANSPLSRTCTIRNVEPTSVGARPIHDTGTGANNGCQQQQQHQASSGGGDMELARRNRFIQNRLIINSKLESMFKNRTSGLESTVIQQQQQKKEPKQQPMQQEQPRQQPKQQQQQSPQGAAAAISRPMPTPPKATLSLRELITEVIDNCEKPNKLSTLTRDLLTRSDSLSSEDGRMNTTTPRAQRISSCID